jgi:hypothetical protein
MSSSASTNVEARISFAMVIKDLKWHIGSEQFLARTEHRGYDKVLEGIQRIPPPSSDPTTDKDQLKLRVANQRAYSDLLLSFNDEVNFVLVSKAKIDEHP